MANFEHKISVKAVTSVVNIVETGPMTLIDSPGFNDDDLKRTDKAILNELTKSIRPRLFNKN